MPIASQLTGGMFLVGRGFDVTIPSLRSRAWLSDDAQKILHYLEPLIIQASEAPDSQHVLKIAEEILKRIDDILKDEPEKPVEGPAEGKEGGSAPKISDKTKDGIAKSDFECKDMSDFIKEHFDEVKLPPNYDGMADKELLKDENQPEDRTITYPDEGSIGEYNVLLMPLRSELNYLVQHLFSLVDKKRQRKRKLAFAHNMKEGVVDSRRLWKLCAGRDDVFKQRQMGDDNQMAIDPDSLAIYLLVDESHSMTESGRYIRAREATIIVCEALDRLGITFALTGYTVNTKLQRILYKAFDESYTEVKTRLLGISHRYGTLTSEHIPFAVRRLEKREERKRILIVITDCDDIESPVRLENAILDAKEAGIEVTGVGIHTNLMSQWYDTFIEVTDMGDFARQLLELLRSVLQR